MASQPASNGGQFVAISAVGTTVVSSHDAIVRRVIIPGTYVGTVNIHDAASATGTSATSQIASFPIPTTSIPQSIEIGVQCRTGIVYQATGTPVMTLVYE